ncbi:hypothetical protein KZO01_13270 [Kurthia zopfii]|uniref:Cell division protein DivIC n=1 Tax=Kurthia zopfii TaxID=1650 RepID=A0A2U3ABP7_9BACL|nr:septum formation initiator family protein [Kurthia zopfii]PWI21881.1 cell division protein DIVIC [Kurthia zopfii]TDR36091.1 cell division protein DivIC [Kurthia zopfii]STX08429.1 Septum formation initiator [Kurthia zopfii]VEI05324.1 Septum formation initiator [Kurthia zopfii]GEK31018.1 hypothetical protein KZO01_13270 [Kurthia zopfii]
MPKKQKPMSTVSRINSDYTQQEKIRKQRLHNKKVSLYRTLAVMSIVFLIALGSLITLLVKQHDTLNQKEEEKVAVEKELKVQEKRQKELNEQLVKLDDNDYIAKIVRKNLFLSKKGEKIFNIPNSLDDEGQIDISKNQKD